MPCIPGAQVPQLSADEVAEQRIDAEGLWVEPLSLDWPAPEPPAADNELQSQGESYSPAPLALPPCCAHAATEQHADGVDAAMRDEASQNPLASLSLPVVGAVREDGEGRGKLPGLCGGVQSVFRRLRRGHF